jgi:hypothetical protein
MDGVTDGLLSHNISECQEEKSKQNQEAHCWIVVFAGVQRGTIKGHIYKHHITLMNCLSSRGCSCKII